MINLGLKCKLGVVNLTIPKKKKKKKKTEHGLGFTAQYIFGLIIDGCYQAIAIFSLSSKIVLKLSCLKDMGCFLCGILCAENDSLCHNTTDMGFCSNVIWLLMLKLFLSIKYLLQVTVVLTFLENIVFIMKVLLYTTWLGFKRTLNAECSSIS